MNHTELVNRAVRWLKNSLHCRVVCSELVAYTRSGETPDAIGWVHNTPILVECKRSRSDFYAEQKRRARHKHMPALGCWRFYFTSPGLLEPEEIIEGWGLYEVHGKKVIHKGGSKYRNTWKPPFTSDRESEVAMLISALSRTLATKHTIKEVI